MLLLEFGIFYDSQALPFSCYFLPGVCPKEDSDCACPIFVVSLLLSVSVVAVISRTGRSS